MDLDNIIREVLTEGNEAAYAREAMIRKAAQEAGDRVWFELRETEHRDRGRVLTIETVTRLLRALLADQE